MVCIKPFMNGIRVWILALPKTVSYATEVNIKERERKSAIEGERYGAIYVSECNDAIIPS